MKKNKSQTSQSFPSYFFRLSLPCSHRYSLMCASVLLFSCMHPLSYSPGIPSLISLYSFISSNPPCLPGKDTPRAFGASFRRHAAPRTLVLTFFSLASIPLLRLSRTL